MNIQLSILAFTLFLVAVQSAILTPALTQLDRECPLDKDLIQQKCVAVIQNCLVYSGLNQCQKCSLGHALKQNKKCQEYQKDLLTTTYQIKGMLNQQELSQAQGLQKTLRESFDNLGQLVGLHLFTKETQTDKYYRLIFTDEKGFRTFLVLADQNPVPVLVAKTHQVYPQKTVIIPKISLKQYQKIYSQIKSLSPYLRSEMFPILKVLKDLGKQRILIVYILDRVSGIVKLQIPIDQQSNQHINEFLKKIDSSLVDIRILNIEPSTIMSRSITYKIKFSTLTIDEGSTTVRVNIDTQQAEFLQENIDRSSPAIESTIQKYLDSVYAPTPQCPNRIPLFSTPKIKFVRKTINDSIIISKEFRDVRNYIVKCYPQFIFHELDRISFAENDNKNYISLRFTVFTEEVSVMLMTLQSGPETNMPNLNEFLITPLDHVKVYQSQQVKENFQLDTLANQIREKYGNPKIRNLIRIEELIWDKFDVEMVRYSFTFCVEDDIYSSVSYTIDMEIGKEEEIIFISQTYQEKEEFSEVSSEKSPQLKQILTAFEQDNLAEVQKFNAFRFYRSQERDYWLICYLVNSQLTVYEFYKGNFLKLRGLQVNNFDGPQSPEIQPFLLFGIEPIVEVIGSSLQSIDSNIESKVHRILVMLKLPTYRSLSILHTQKFLKGNLIRFFVELTLVNQQLYYIIFDCLETANHLIVINLYKQGVQIPAQTENMELTEAQKGFINRFIDPYSFNKIRAQSVNGDFIRVVGASMQFGLIQLIFQVQKDEENHEIQLIVFNSLDNGYNQIGFDLKSLIKGNPEYKDKQNILHRQVIKSLEQSSAINIENLCKPAIWRLKKFDSKNYEIDIFYECESRESVFDANLLCRNGQVVYVNTKEQYFNLSIARNNVKSQQENRMNEITADITYQQSENFLFRFYPHFFHNRKLLNVQKTVKDDKIYYLMLYKSSSRLLRAFVKFDNTLKQPQIESLTPAPVHSPVINNADYICEVLQLLNLPEQYCDEIKLPRSFYNEEREGVTEECLIKIGLICLY